MAERSIVSAVARVKKEVGDLLISVGFVEKVGNQRTSMTLPTAADAYLRWYADRHGSTAPD